LNFPPKEMIWWTLKMYFWEILNIGTLLEFCWNSVGKGYDGCSRPMAIATIE